MYNNNINLVCGDVSQSIGAGNNSDSFLRISNGSSSLDSDLGFIRMRITAICDLNSQSFMHADLVPPCMGMEMVIELAISLSERI